MAAAPVINAVLEDHKDEEMHYLYVTLERSFWKDPNCVFRKDESTMLKSLPTMMKWGTQQRLGEDQCSNKELVEMLFE